MKNNKMKVVYILGNSFSGSSVLGLILGSDEKVFNAGEINKYSEAVKNDFKSDRKSEINNICTCGEKLTQCKFWRNLHDQYGDDTKFNPSPGFSWKNFWLLLKRISNAKGRVAKNSQYAQFVREVSLYAQEYKQSIDYVVDGSKSILTLDWLINSNEFEIKIIHLQRNLIGNVNSFKKHGYSFTYGLLSWLINNWIIEKYIKKIDADVLEIKYKDLCQKTTRQFEKLNNFLGTDLNTKNYIDGVNREKYHVFAGNPFLKKEDKFNGLEYRYSNDNLNKLEFLLLSLLTKR